jgi:Domain of unknown function (DUF4253)
MLNTSASIIALLEGTILEGQTVIPLEIPESSHCAFAIAVDDSQSLAAWHLMRSRLELTNRYPVLVVPWLSSPKGWEQEVLENNFFSRFYYQEEPFQGDHQDTSPAAIIARVPQVNLEDFLAKPPTLYEDDLPTVVDFALAETARRFGSSPDQAELQQLIQDGAIASQRALEKWLFDWELQNSDPEQASIASDISYLDWYKPHSPPILILLPTTDSWNALAYLHWYGAGSIGSEVASRFLQRWSQRYSAELVCHYGTMLQFQVEKPPTTPVAAFELAWEQYALAPYTLQASGISLRDHARSLLSIHRWFLHERP